MVSPSGLVRMSAFGMLSRNENKKLAVYNLRFATEWSAGEYSISKKSTVALYGALSIGSLTTCCTSMSHSGARLSAKNFLMIFFCLNGGNLDPASYTYRQATA